MKPAWVIFIGQLLRRTLVLQYAYRQVLAILLVCFFSADCIQAQKQVPDSYQIVWDTQSKNSSASMPCGGGDIGLNVWVENGELLMYLSQSGMFDENNAMLKAGRVRLQLYPNPFAGQSFRQELKLNDGYVHITGSNGTVSADINVWVDVFHPAIHLDVNSSKPVTAIATYESWRYRNRPSPAKENKANSWKWANQAVVTQKDQVNFADNRVLFYHQNTDSTVFDVTVKQQGLDGVKQQLFNPLQSLVFGGSMQGTNMYPASTYEGKYLDADYKGWKLAAKKPSGTHSIDIVLHTSKAASVAQWQQELTDISKQAMSNKKTAWENTKQWWHQFWQRSFVWIDADQTDKTAIPWQTGRNYQLFRYMLGCNAFGKYPTKFNGGLFTSDPVFTDSSLHGTPDYRSWGGGTFTAQNQRLVYWPMLKSGDVEMMQPQFDFYRQILTNAELRTQTYWKHRGASFSEQIENFGLPNMAEYGLKRPADFDKGVEYNAWLEYEWDTVLEFCMMLLEAEKYTGKDISAYMPLIESSLVFFDEHYQYLAKQRGNKKLDGNGKLVLYPGSATETYKMAYNANSTIAALQTVTKALLSSKYLNTDRRTYFEELLSRIPPLNFRSFDGHTTLAPAKLWERVNNIETPQLYPVYPWGMYGIGKPGLDTALNTWLYDTMAIKFRDHTGWKQDNIFAARLGLTEEAARLTSLKLQDGPRRFPAFWGPGFDWLPDHNHGGSGMIGLQEMLLQTNDKQILLFPSWKKNWNVHFKLHAPYATTVEVTLKNGTITQMEVLPKERLKDVVNYLQ